MSDTLTFVIMFSGIFSLGGILFLITGILILYIKKRKEIRCTLSTSGKIIDYVKHYVRGENEYHMVYEYNVGKLKYIKEYPYVFSSKYSIGQDIEVHYNPENYNEHYIVGDTFQKTKAKITIIAGIFSIIIAVLSAIIIL